MEQEWNFCKQCGHQNEISAFHANNQDSRLVEQEKVQAQEIPETLKSQNSTGKAILLGVGLLFGIAVLLGIISATVNGANSNLNEQQVAEMIARHCFPSGDSKQIYAVQEYSENGVSGYSITVEADPNHLIGSAYLNSKQRRIKVDANQTSPGLYTGVELTCDANEFKY